MKHIQNITWLVVAMGLLNSCKKDSTAAVPPPLSVANCVLKSEATSLVGNEKTFEYQYDQNGNPKEVKIYNRFGGLISTCRVGSNTVTWNNNPQTEGWDRETNTVYQTSDIFTGFPAKASVSFREDLITQVNVWTYFFFYDAKGRLITVGEQTDNVPGDWEYDLNISYDKNDNVTSLQYVWTTGPREPIPPITVKKYDDKPTPYAGVKGWQFLNVNFAWNNYDPEPLITALSKNNPLDYTMGAGADKWERNMVYTYNEAGFPIERKNTNKHEGGEYTFLQTFAYDCQ
jgi:hypothetical protein